MHICCAPSTTTQAMKYGASATQTQPAGLQASLGRFTLQRCKRLRYSSPSSREQTWPLSPRTTPLWSLGSYQVCSHARTHSRTQPLTPHVRMHALTYSLARSLPFPTIPPFQPPSPLLPHPTHATRLQPQSSYCCGQCSASHLTIEQKALCQRVLYLETSWVGFRCFEGCSRCENSAVADECA